MWRIVYSLGLGLLLLLPAACGCQRRDQVAAEVVQEKEREIQRLKAELNTREKAAASGENSQPRDNRPVPLPTPEKKNAGAWQVTLADGETFGVTNLKGEGTDSGHGPLSADYFWFENCRDEPAAEIVEPRPLAASNDSNFSIFGINVRYLRRIESLPTVPMIRPDGTVVDVPGKWYRVEYDTPFGVRETMTGAESYPNSVFGSRLVLGKSTDFECRLSTIRTLIQVLPPYPGDKPAAAPPKPFLTLSTTHDLVLEPLTFFQVAAGEPPPGSLPGADGGAVGKRAGIAKTALLDTLLIGGKLKVEIPFAKIAEISMENKKENGGLVRLWNGEIIKFDYIKSEGQIAFCGSLADGRCFKLNPAELQRAAFTPPGGGVAR